MKRLFGYVILKEEEFKAIHHTDQEVRRYKQIAEDSSIGKQMKELETKYADYIGKWFRGEDGVIFKIQAITYSGSSWNRWRDHFMFLCSAPNHDDTFEMGFSSISIEEALTEEEVKGYLLGGSDD